MAVRRWLRLLAPPHEASPGGTQRRRPAVVADRFAARRRSGRRTHVDPRCEPFGRIAGPYGKRCARCRVTEDPRNLDQSRPHGFMIPIGRGQQPCRAAFNETFRPHHVPPRDPTWRRPGVCWPWQGPARDHDGCSVDGLRPMGRMVGEVKVWGGGVASSPDTQGPRSTVVGCGQPPESRACVAIGAATGAPRAPESDGADARRQSPISPRFPTIQ
jgi:hypothetical protein